MQRLALAFVLLSLAAAPAHASGSIACASPDGGATARLTIGSLPVLAVVGAVIEADGTEWALGGEGEGAISVGQAFGGEGEMRVDFTDPNVERVVAELRLFAAAEGRDAATAGTLKIAGHGAWPLVCVGP